MKKSVSILLVITLLFATLSLLVSCGGGEELPEGMKLLRGGEDIGYYFYAPEEWTSANHADIACAFASKVDNSSISYAEGQAVDEAALDAYFDSELARLPFNAVHDTQKDKRHEAVNFGNADKAFRYTYEYKYTDYSFRTMQIFVYFGDRFGIFTYNSYTHERSEGTSYYEFYMQKVLDVIKNFKFVDKSGSVAPTPEYTTDSDGYKLVSDKTLCGFNLFVPESFEVDYSSGVVSATHADGSNINMSKATYTGVTVEQYFEHRKAELETLTEGEVTVLASGEAVSIEGTKWAHAYEYKYTLLGKEYHVYQVFIVKGYEGYVFTYTAPEALFEGHLSEAKTCISKIGF